MRAARLNVGWRPVLLFAWLIDPARREFVGRGWAWALPVHTRRRAPIRRRRTWYVRSAA